VANVYPLLLTVIATNVSETKMHVHNLGVSST